MVINMTTPYERTRALLYVGELLSELSNPAKTPGVPEEIRERARHALRHYPSAGDIEAIAEHADRGALSGSLLDAAAARGRRS